MGVGRGLPLRVALRPDQPAVGGQLLQQLVVCLSVDGQAGVPGYLRAIGLTDDQIEALRRATVDSLT